VRRRVLSASLLATALALVAAGSAALPARAETTSQRLVSIARAELQRGVHEVPDGSNRGARIRMYGLSTTARSYPAPWCAYFASYVARQAGVPVGAGGRGLGYVPYIRAWAKQTGRWTQTPRPGYLITFPQHVGVVETVSRDGTLTTIEGNSGNAVRRRWRRWTEATGYVRLAAGGALSAPGSAPAPSGPGGQALRARITAYPGLRIAAGQSVDFTSNDSSGAVARSDWDLTGSGRYAVHGDNVSRRYPTPGTYRIRLRVRDRRGRTATATATLVVRSNRAPVANLAIRPAAQVLAGTTITGDASASIDPDGRIVRYAWDLDGNGEWGDGGPQHSVKLTVPGDYSVGLRVYDDDGNVTETHAAVHVSDLPAPVLRATCSAPTIASGQRLTCRADTAGSPVPFTRVQWDMNGDGTFEATGASAGLTYTRPGAYTVSARGTDRRGRVASATVAVRVANRPPTARIAGAATVALGSPVTLDARASTDPDGRVVAFAWDLDGDGRPDPAAPVPPAAPPVVPLVPPGTATLTAITPGPHVVGVWVTDDLGAVSTARLTVTVTNRPPVARIAAPAHATVGATVALDGSGSTDPDGTIARYDWDLDADGTYEAAGASVSLTFAHSGSHTMRLRVTDAFGATATAVRTVDVT
jgi:PKD repeat protein